jgi:hypothetical protein
MGERGELSEAPNLISARPPCSGKCYVNRPNSLPLVCAQGRGVVGACYYCDNLGRLLVPFPVGGLRPLNEWLNHHRYLLFSFPAVQPASKSIAELRSTLTHRRIERRLIPAALAAAVLVLPVAVLPMAISFRAWGCLGVIVISSLPLLVCRPLRSGLPSPGRIPS